MACGFRGVAYVFPVLFAAVLSFSLPCAADAVTWCGPDGGDWNNGENWSSGSVPTSSDVAYFPDHLNGADYTIRITGSYGVKALYVEDRKASAGEPAVKFTGGGTLSSTGVAENYLRQYRKLVLDGVTLRITGHYILVYGALEVKSGSTFENTKLTYLFRGFPSILVESGGSVRCSGGVSNLFKSSITVDGGSFECSSITRGSGSSDPLDISVRGGSLTVVDLLLHDGAKLSMTGGLMAITGSATVPDDTQISITGGRIVLPSINPPAKIVSDNTGATIEYTEVFRYIDGPVLARSVLETLSATSLVVASSSDAAVDVFQHNGQLDHEIEVGGALYVTNGCINFNRRGLLGGEYPVHVKAFRIGDIYGYPTIRFKTIVSGRDYPFTTLGGNPLNIFYLEGPTTFRTRADVDAPTTNVVVMASGDVTVDTRDYADGTARIMRLDGFAAKDASSIKVLGGGELIFRQAHSGSPFSRIEIADGTTLTLAPLSQDADYGPLHADEIVLGPDSVLNIPAGSNSVHAAKWTVDPSARVNVILSEGITTDAKGLMYDFSGEYRIPESQIRLVGATDAAVDGWGLVPADGTWAVTNANADLTLESGFEWTGAGQKDYTMFADPANWNADGAKPIQANDYVFGASNDTSLIWFYRVYANASAETASGSTVKSVRFRNTATKSFTITNVTMTFSRKGDYKEAGVSSFSVVPHYFANPMRTDNHLSLCAASEGPLVFRPTSNFNSKYDNSDSCKMRVVGDVRFGRTISWTRADFGASSNEYAHLSLGSRITVLSGGSLTYTNQTIAVKTPYAGFRVNEGGTLTFSNGGGTDKYQWSSPAYGAKNTVEGTMNLNVPLCGGNDYSFGGSGVLNISAVQPSANYCNQYPTGSRRSRVSFGDSLTVNQSEDWTTVSSGADYPLVIKAYGTPTLRTGGDWMYGPEDGFESAVDLRWRAAEVTAGSVLTVDPSGGTATFADPVCGKGTLAITNGTLLTSGGVTNTLGIAVRAGGVYEWGEARAIRSLSCEAGGVLRFTAFAPLSVKEEVDLSGSAFEWPDDLDFASAPRWRTLLVSKTGFSGMPAVSGGVYDFRMVETGGGFALQIRKKSGTAVCIR